MMTIEEKAKAYDEAIEMAKNRLKDCHGDCFLRREIEKIFPDLAESEDERIRKEILECIETLIKQPGASPRLCDWLAWLEKQKEPDSEEIEALKNSIDREYIIPKERIQLESLYIRLTT